ncbi:MAG TPA: twin-arginine translocase TatA/TatE family subunit [Solirubrobacteraceae bacterium]|jgi:sec-independent protein translocase protein TatA
MDIGGHLPEIIIVLVIILIIWGPGKLPDVGAAMGRGIREFRKASAETRDAVRHATAPEEPAAPTPAPTAPPPDPAPASPSGGPSSSDPG